MFTTEELQAIDRKYFTVIVADAYEVTFISNNTRHVWYIHNVELKDRNLCLVYHKHHINHPYHSHSRCGTLRRAIRDMPYLFVKSWLPNTKINRTGTRSADNSANHVCCAFAL